MAKFEIGDRISLNIGDNKYLLNGGNIRHLKTANGNLLRGKIHCHSNHMPGIKYRVLFDNGIQFWVHHTEMINLENFTVPEKTKTESSIVFPQVRREYKNLELNKYV